MLYKWLVLPLMRKLNDAKRRSMLTEFHKISTVRWEKIDLGLRLILGENGKPLQPLGRLDLRTPSFQILEERLIWCIHQCNDLVCIGESANMWESWPRTIDPCDDHLGPRWLDVWFGTSDPAVIHESLCRVFKLMSDNELLFSNDSDVGGVFVRQSSHLLRDLEVVILNYL